VHWSLKNQMQHLLVVKVNCSSSAFNEQIVIKASESSESVHPKICFILQVDDIILGKQKAFLSVDSIAVFIIVKREY